ncbi:GNAT family N-acetyltransferase [Daejeonella sp. JGW-45]|uniref:GNAT family N-acetyltransferase n=1 Tax=Daejeonella sp. JGW-45 TaxID=3034148 RepID=UPI0023EE14C5|nr:GNAT family N-acetyltransferase [Daejeonella sp. JGW-45]
MHIVRVSQRDIPVIHQLAHQIWWPTYSAILSEEQISFMLKNMYSPDALGEQIKNGSQFILVKNEGTDVAFAGYSIEAKVLKIHKIYILPSEQGKGTGRKLIEYLDNIARECGISKLQLNVNRANPALSFYQKVGFKIVKTVDIPYFEFVLNDYVMRKEV